MYSTIMVPTDCTGFDREAIRVALRLAEKTSAKVHLVRVSASTSFIGLASTGDGLALSSEGLQQEIDAELSELHALAAECRTISTADVTTSLEQGSIADALAGYANRNHVDLIVITTHGRSGFARFSLGSVTDSLIRLTTIPVLVVKPPRSYLNPQVAGAFKRIVVPLDGSALSEQILSRVARLAEIDGAELTLLYVLKPHTYSQEQIQHPLLPWWEKDIASAEAYLFPMAAKLRRRGLTVSSDIVIGENVADKIAEFARCEKADLIAIATHGRGGVARLIHGSVADALTKAARASVFVFHPAAKQTATDARPLSERNIAVFA
ncbi:MAG TPA: universal stress protein [Gemmatimonadaceae bacterium]|nr:universal stress protein [Gemmatimonadaceae bacterium]